MNENALIESLRDGDEFVGFYALRRCELKESEGLFRLELELLDRTGHVPAVVWNDAKELNGQLTRGQVAKVQGVMTRYREKPQVRVEKIRPARPEEYDLTTLLPSTPGDVADLTARTERLAGSVREPNLQKLLGMIFGNPQFRKEFTRCPGGTRWHHPYLGGLLEHTVGVAELCDFIASGHPELNHDLLVTAALLHDVGKIREFSVTTLIEYSDEGRLEGHIILGERFVRNMCERIDGFPGHLKMLLSHLMLSHQGFKEFSSPVEPMIPEGFALYYADELDSKLNALRRIKKETLEDGSTWSEFVKVLNRFIYTGNQDERD